MASLRKKDRSPFWFACYALPDGRRTQRSTGTDDKRKALIREAELVVGLAGSLTTYLVKKTTS